MVTNGSNPARRLAELTLELVDVPSPSGAEQVLAKRVSSLLSGGLELVLDDGESVYIVDLRHPRALLRESFTLPGAHCFTPQEMATRHHEIPRDRDIVLYCDCPNEATAAKAALTLHRLGIKRVRPLRGGYDEWKRLGFPLDATVPVPQPPAE